MANSLTDNPWTIDTPGAGVLWSSRVKIRHIEFAGYALNADTCQVTDKNGRVVWDGDGHDDLAPVISDNIGWVNGIIVPTLSAGVVRIYIE